MVDDKRTAQIIIAAATAGVAVYAAYKLFCQKSCRRSSPTFDTGAFSSQLKTEKLGRKLEYHEVVDSTMLLAKKSVTKGADLHGSIFLAEHQTAGKGRRGRSWQSSNASNLMFTFVWTVSKSLPQKEAMEEMLKLNFCISIATAFSCRHVGAKHASVKWPNDVWHEGKKLSGMLVDLEGMHTALAGVGINVNWDIPASDPLSATATSLSAIAGGPVSRETVLAHFCNEIERLMALPMPSVMQEYRSLDMIMGKRVRVHHSSRETAAPEDYDAVATGFADDGGLVVQPDGSTRTVTLRGEEVSIRPV
eukprot:m.20459 g.20459  ORF g.20459 m.20459 type:complete len:306 (-) comp3535_c0_seq1:110-1027(-)